MRKKSEFLKSSYLNNSTYLNYCERIQRIATARFKWKNTPDSWDTDFLEKTLYTNGVVGAIYIEELGDILTSVTPTGGLNIYGMPIKVTCTSSKHFHKQRYVYTGIKKLEKENCVVLIKNNPEMTSTAKLVELFCLRLYEVDRTIDVNLKQQKTPCLVLSDEKQRLTMLNLYKEYDGNQPFIFGDKNLLGDQNSIRTLSTNAPFLLDKLVEFKQSLWNELLTVLGINNINYEKRERLITAEANANNHFTNLNLYGELKCREKACEQINKYFGLNISVELNSELCNYDFSENVEKEVENVE